MKADEMDFFSHLFLDSHMPWLRDTVMSIFVNFWAASFYLQAWFGVL